MRERSGNFQFLHFNEEKIGKFCYFHPHEDIERLRDARLTTRTVVLKRFLVHPDRSALPLQESLNFSLGRLQKMLQMCDKNSQS
jgi:hypothetical protein